MPYRTDDEPSTSELVERPALYFHVYGRPQTAGSKRAFPVKKKGGAGWGVAVTDDNPKSREWKNQVAEAGAAARADYFGPDDDGELLDGPLRLHVLFTFARPKSHFGTGRFARRVKPAAPDEHVIRPDCTKLVRAVEDALTGVVWRDDAQVVAQQVRKRYGAQDGAEVAIWAT